MERGKITELLKTAWAKSDGTSIREHTDTLLENLKTLREAYGETISRLCPKPFRSIFWKVLELCCEYHDYGKIHCHFQKKVGNRDWKIIKDLPEVRHNILSPAFVEEEDEFLRILVQKVVLHHHEVREKDKEKAGEVLRREFGMEDLGTLPFLWNVPEERFFNMLSSRFGYKEEDVRKLYILLKGLLLRIDHGSSNRQVKVVEVKPTKDAISSVREYLKISKNSDLNPVQKFVAQNVENNLLLTAPTGYGKTEAGFIFSQRKGFFTLPFRVSANGIYRRAKKVFGENYVGLLHSSALSELISEEGEMDTNRKEGLWKHYHLSKNLSQPLVVCTPDQILSFVLRFEGFEKLLATLSYSRVIVDELQVYEPYTMAFIVKALEKIKEIGGKFMVMTATFPEFLRDHFEKMEVKTKEFAEEKPRHNVRLIKNSLESEEALKLIERISSEGKVLVVVNTVSRAQNLKEKLSFAQLLHSRFVQKDRREKEDQIGEFFNGTSNGVWITTQLAEVSLDLDADFLITELSPADSLIQRLGRCNRRGLKDISEPNVFIFTEDPSGVGGVYEKDLLEITKKHLKEGLWDGEIKGQFVKRVFGEEIKRTKYFQTFRNALMYVDSLWTGELRESRREALEKFRDIRSVSVIPETFREEALAIYSRWLSESDPIKKALLLNDLLDLSFSHPWHRSLFEKGVFIRAGELAGLNLCWARGEYDAELGFVVREASSEDVIL